MAFVSVGGDRGGAARPGRGCGLGLSSKFLLLIGLIGWFSSSPLVTGLQCYECNPRAPCPQLDNSGREKKCDYGKEVGCYLWIDIEAKESGTERVSQRGCAGSDERTGCGELILQGGFYNKRECYCKGDLCNTNEADIRALAKLEPPPAPSTENTNSAIVSVSTPALSNGSPSPASNSTAAKPGSSSAPTRHPKRIDWIVLVLVTFCATSSALFTNNAISSAPYSV